MVFCPVGRRPLITAAKFPSAVAGPFVYLVAAGILGGVGTYVVVILAGRSLTEADYSDFSWFWSLVVLIGLGLFLPIEQEIARRGAIAGARAVPVRSALPTVVLVAVVSAALALAITIAVARGTNTVVLCSALAATSAAYALQYVVKGELAAQLRVSEYAAVTAIEAVLRIALSAVFAVMGGGELVAFVAVIPVAAVLSAACGLALLTRARRAPAGSEHSTDGSQDTAQGFGTSVRHRVASSIVLQVLLNFAPIAAFVFEGGAGATPGLLLVLVSLARVPIFGYQSVQGALLPRLIALGQARGHRAYVVAARWTVAAAALLAMFWSAALLIGGALLIEVFFGTRYVVPSSTVALVAGAFAILLTAMVTSDALLAAGRHRSVSVSWFASLAVAVGCALALQDLTLRSVLPIAAGGLMFLTIGLIMLTRPERS